jgi:hypothetical protein
VYAAVLTIFCGLFFTIEGVQESQIGILGFFLLTLAANIAFLAIWGARFVDVVFRTRLPQASRWLKCLKGFKDYDTDLKEAITLSRRVTQVENPRS